MGSPGLLQLVLAARALRAGPSARPRRPSSRRAGQAAPKARPCSRRPRSPSPAVVTARPFRRSGQRGGPSRSRKRAVGGQRRRTAPIASTASGPAVSTCPGQRSNRSRRTASKCGWCRGRHRRRHLARARAPLRRGRLGRRQAARSVRGLPGDLRAVGPGPRRSRAKSSLGELLKTEPGVASARSARRPRGRSSAGSTATAS